ncbi:hypothetical protein BJX96DRAFT_149240 [Aspergillus floccosus]
MAPEPQPHTLEGDVHKESIDAKATAADDSQASDNEGGERPVRNKLRDTSITSAPKPPTATEPATEKTQEGSENSRASSRGRKRSLDEDQPEMDEDDAGHRRKRSRDNSYEEEIAASKDSEQAQNPEDAAEKILSPKKKRSRDQLDKEEPKPEGAAEKADDIADDSKPTEKVAEEGQPEKKRHRDSSQERQASVTGAFANTSAVSPFGSLAASKPKEEETTKPAATSSSAFASSTFAAFASSEKSPFGASGTSGSVFKSPAPTETEKPATTGSGFASAAGSSGFATLGSGFSSFAGGFGAAAPKGGLTSFASPAGPSDLGGSSKDKPFGAPAEEEENEEETGAESGPGEFEEDKTDERFFERPIETGEEEEKTYFSCKAKLFQFSDKEWKERGIGTFKVNVRIVDGEENKKAARMIMRADGVLRVMLNTPLFKGMTVGDASGNEPKSKQIHLASLENGRSVPCLLRTGSEDLANELYHVIRDLLEHQ